MDKIILIGAGGHAKSVVDTIERNGIFEIAGFLDKGEVGQKVYHTYQVIGHDEDLPDLFQDGIRYAFVCVGFMGNSDVRNRLYDTLKSIGYKLPVIVDDSAVIAADARIGEGTYIGKNAVLNAEASVGKMCIINTSAVADHETVVEDFSHIAVGAVLCGRVRVGANTLVGANATIIQNVEIGTDSIIGAGSVVLNDIPSACTAAGIPARVVKRR